MRLKGLNVSSNFKRRMLLVTHDVELAASAADRLVLMSQGEISAAGVPAHVLGALELFAPQIARLFPGSGWLTAQDAESWFSRVNVD